MSSSLAHAAVIFAVIVGLIFLSSVNVLSRGIDAGRATVDFINTPIVGGLQKVEDFFSTLIELRRLAVQNSLLERQVQELTADVVSLESMQEENRELREALGFRTESALDLIPAQVISSDPLNINQTLTLNRGSRHGVEQGSAVVVSGGILVGVVSKTLENTSQMEIISSSGIAVNAEVVPGGATGVIKGEHGLGLLLDFVSQSDSVNPGDRIITSGLGGQFPGNLLIGEVGTIRSSESDLFRSASVFPIVDLRNLHLVFVVSSISP